MSREASIFLAIVVACMCGCEDRKPTTMDADSAVPVKSQAAPESQLVLDEAESILRRELAGENVIFKRVKLEGNELALVVNRETSIEILTSNAMQSKPVKLISSAQAIKGFELVSDLDKELKKPPPPPLPKLSEQIKKALEKIPVRVKPTPDGKGVVIIGEKKF